MDPRQRERERESQRTLARMAQESDPSGSLMARAAGRARDHMSGADADPSDPAELWGTRIGRALGLVLLVGLMVYLYVTYFA